MANTAVVVCLALLFSFATIQPVDSHDNHGLDQTQYQGTIKADPSFRLSTVAEAVRKAIRGPGTDESSLIKVFTHCTLEQRIDIRRYYKKRYKSDLLEDIRDDTMSNFQHVMESLLMKRYELNAFWLHEAMSGIGTDETLLINILLTLDKLQMSATKKYYKKDYKKNLRKILRSELRGHLEKIVLFLTKRGRIDENKPIKQKKVRKDIEELRNPSPPTKVYTRILMRRSFKHIKEILNAENGKVYQEVEQKIMKHFRLYNRELFLGTVQYIDDPGSHFAHILHDCLDQPGTHDDLLVWILVSRSEIDLEAIKVSYKNLYKKELKDRIVEDVDATDYVKALTCILDPDNC